MKAQSTRHHPPAGSDGLPGKPAELMQRDYLIMLLHIAAELEQSLMVQYLYAAYSLGGEHARKHEAKVQEWRNAILGVAKEEMGHLLTVQNVLCLLGGPISFEREDYPWDTPYYPFVFCLEKLTLESLAKYVFAEMPKPEDCTSNDADLLVIKDVKQILKHKPGSPVGEVYDKIIELVADESKIPDSDFNPDSYGIQASFDDWGRGYRPGPFPPHAVITNTPPGIANTRLIIRQMATRTEALAALRDLAGQGESPLQPRSKTEPSHFERFAKIFRELKAIQKAEPGWCPCRDVPENPVIADPTKEAITGATCITAEPSRTWASLFNVRYRMLLSYLTHTFSLQRSSDDALDAIRPAVMSKVFGEMYNLKAIAGILVRLPLAEATDPRRAGPTFQMPYTLVLPSSEVDIWRQHRDLVGSSLELVSELMHPDKNNLEHAPPDGTKYLAALRDLDLQSIAFIDQILLGLRPIRRGRR
jgi:hypothetical protein